MYPQIEFGQQGDLCVYVPMASRISTQRKQESTEVVRDEGLQKGDM